MARYSNTVRNQYDQPVEGASVYVYTFQGDLADLEQDGGGALDNPVTTDEYGNFYFNADDGIYTLTFHYGGREILQQNYVEVGTGPVLPADILAALGNPSGASLIGSAGPSTVQLDLDVRPTSAVLAAPGGAGGIGWGRPVSPAFVPAFVRDRLARQLLLTDFLSGSASDDQHVGVQAAVDKCLSYATPADLIVDAEVLLTSSVMIDRMVVNEDDTQFKLIGQGLGAGFRTVGNVTMFDSTFNVTTDPLSEFISFNGLRFSSSSVFNNSYVLSKKFLRIWFEDCFFWITRCVDSPIYLQSWYFHACKVRNWLTNFIKCHGTFDVSIAQSLVESGACLIDTIDSARGTLGLRITDNVIELLSDTAIKVTGAFGVVIGNNHMEQIGGSVGINFDGGSLAGGTAFVHGNTIVNPYGPAFYWDNVAEVTSVGNVCGSPDLGAGSTLHANVAATGSFTSIGDKAGTISDAALPFALGSVRSKIAPSELAVALAYSTDITPDARLARRFIITATNGSAFILRSPVAGVTGQRVTITIKNTSGGSLGTITWATYKMAAWTSPATGNNRSITFEYDGTNWIQVEAVTPDIPN